MPEAISQTNAPAGRRTVRIDRGEPYSFRGGTLE
jgi:hypothetical protein